MVAKTSLEDKKNISNYRAILETTMYGNNVVPVNSVAEAYELAKKAPGTIVTDQDVFQPEAQGLPIGAKVLVMNDGEVYGRFAGARKIAGMKGVNSEELSAVLREAAYHSRFKKMYCAEAYVGLHEGFIIKARLLIPEGFENNVLSWMLNFQETNAKYQAIHKNSKELDAKEIVIFSDPTYYPPAYPLGLAFFDTEHNCACLLGMRYFGEHKKGTLTLAWKTANKLGYASCHGGLKRYNNNGYVAAFFGLSGSGKSTLTHAKHDGKYDITVLHDDAFIINVKEKYSIALEPAYFDKTQDYAIGSEDNKYILTAQNIGVMLDSEGKKILVTEDIRNPNGRAVKSKLWTPNRIDRIDEKIKAVFWLMKDPTLPPVVKITDPILGAVLGATLATKRTSAERLAPGVDPNALVIEPYANPFRTYPLAEDYQKFKELLSTGVECFILNTGDFMGTKVKPADTIGIIEAIVEGTASFKFWAGALQILELDPKFMPNLADADYNAQLKARMEDRVKYFESRSEETGGFDVMPDECIAAVRKMLESI